MSIAGVHTPTMGKDERLTPPDLLEKLGQFDLDPCAPEPTTRPWSTATHHYSKPDDGLSCEWFGRVWCNPPYGKETAKWLHKLADHGNGTALIYARTETRMFFSEVWGKATAVLFIKGRLHFYHVDGTQAKANSGRPSVLVAYGHHDAYELERSGIQGVLIWR